MSRRSWAIVLLLLASGGLGWVVYDQLTANKLEREIDRARQWNGGPTDYKPPKP